MTARLTHEQAEARCLENGFRWPEGVVFEGVMTKYPLVCLTCGDDTPKVFNNVGYSGCKKCASVAYRLTQKEAEAQGLRAKYPALLLEGYKGAVIKHKYRFLNCGHEWETRPNDLHNGNGCGECFFDQGLTYLYLMEHQGLDAFKIGVTAVEHRNPLHSRIHIHGLDGWTLVHKAEFATRKEALALEAAIVDSWRAQGFPPALTLGQIRSGHGETVSRQLATANSIKQMMQPDWYPGESWNTKHSNASTMAAAANPA